jgi:hypothetical protein
LAAVRSGPFGHNMTLLQNQRIVAAAEGVYSVFEALEHIVHNVSSEDWESCADVHLTSIDREDEDGFSDRSIERKLVALIDRTCQQGSGNSDVQPDVSNNLEYRTHTHSGWYDTVPAGYFINLFKTEH